MIIFLNGFMGSGKTYWGRIWSRVYNLPFFDLDELIEQQHQNSIAGIFEIQGEAIFREMETAALQKCSQKKYYQ